jgi:hypothetical protein
MDNNQEDYYKTVQNWLTELKRKRFSRQNTRHPVMMYLRTKADDKYRELFPKEKSVFDENVVPNR